MIKSLIIGFIAGTLLIVTANSGLDPLFITILAYFIGNTQATINFTLGK